MEETIYIITDFD